MPTTESRLKASTSSATRCDLGRVLGFLLNDEIPTPNGMVQEAAHEYGLVVLVYAYLERFVDEPDRETLRNAFRAWLREDRAASVALASRRETASGERLHRLLESSRLKELRPELEALLRERTNELAGLSPRGQLSGIGAPVYLLHGAGDTVIPPSETDGPIRISPARRIARSFRR